jgi:putative hydrolase of the HAD superfamily
VTEPSVVPSATPTATPIEAVIFDYGGVISVPFLRDLHVFEAQMGYPEGSVSLLMFGERQSHLVEGSGDPCDAAEGDDVSPELHDFHLLEMGRLSLAQYLGGLVQRAPEILGRAIDFGAYQQFVTSSQVGVHWPVVHRIRALRDDGVELALLTNNVKEFGDTWRAMVPVEELFPVVVDSSVVGMRKPDPRIYEHTCDLVGVAPAAAVFVDDNADNVAAAAALGIETVHFGTDPLAAIAELDAILARRGTRGA